MEFHKPKEKSDAYWAREMTSNGQRINDALDRHESVSAGRRRNELDGYSAEQHDRAWAAHERNKAEWRGELKETGRLITPEDRAYMDEWSAMELAQKEASAYRLAAQKEISQEDKSSAGRSLFPYGDFSLPEVLGRDSDGRLHREPTDGPALIVHDDRGDAYGGVFNRDTKFYIENGSVIASRVVESSQGEEGSSYTEKWHDADGKLHSFNGNPSVIRSSVHDILSETYLDESVMEFHRHGEFVDSVDRTYDDVVSKKGLPIEALQNQGYDPDPDYTPTQRPGFPNRFDGWQSSQDLAHKSVLDDPKVAEALDYLVWAIDKKGIIVDVDGSSDKPVYLRSDQLAEIMERKVYQVQAPDISSEVSQDWGAEIVRRYAAETRGNGEIVDSAPKIERPMDLESYRQDRMFYGKHETSHADREAAWAAASTIPAQTRHEQEPTTQLKLGL